MHSSLLAPPLPSSLDTNSELFVRNRADMLDQIQVNDELLDMAAAGGGDRAIGPQRSRG